MSFLPKLIYQFNEILTKIIAEHSADIDKIASKFMKRQKNENNWQQFSEKKEVGGISLIARLIIKHSNQGCVLVDKQTHRLTEQNRKQRNKSWRSASHK